MYVENFGTGISRILDSYNNHNKKPIFVDTDNTFKVTLYNINYRDINKKISHSNLIQEEKIVEYLIKNNEITRKKVEKLLNISSSRAKYILNKMCDREIIDKVGYGKNIMYLLKQK